MNADRTVLTDAMWAQVEHMSPGKASDPGGSAADNRLFLKAVPVRFRTGSPWRDLAGMSAFLDDLPFGAFVGDRAFDTDWLIGEL